MAGTFSLRGLLPRSLWALAYSTLGQDARPRLRDITLGVTWPYWPGVLFEVTVLVQYQSLK